MDRFLLDLRQAVHRLTKKPLFAVAFILTVALGIGANACIFSIVDAVLLRPLPYEEADRLVTVWSSNPQEGHETYQVSPPDFFDLAAQNDVLDSIAAIRTNGGNLVGDGEAERVMVGEVSADLFKVLRRRPLIGRPFQPEENESGATPVVILGHGLWQRRYGSDPAVVGKSIGLNDQTYQVVGVMPADFDFPSEAQLWIPRAFQAAERTERARGLRIYEVLARLKPGITLEAAQAEVSTIAARLASEHPEDNQGWGFRLVPLREQIVGEVRPILLLLQGAVLFVMLMVCANLTNLLLVRAISREREICIRTALGAQKARLAGQLLTETLLLAIVGGLLGLVLAVWGTRLFTVTFAAAIPRLTEQTLSGGVLALVVALAIVTTLLGLVQLRLTAKVDLIEALKDRGASAAGRSSHRLRNLLVMTQVAVATVLLIGTGLILRSLEKLQRVEPGFRIGNVLIADLSLPRTLEKPRQTELIQTVVDRLSTLPGVKAAGASTTLPLTPQESLDFSFSIVGRPVAGPDDPGMEAGFDAVTPDYFRAMGIPLLKGRAFTKDDREGSQPVIIISREMARQHWPNQDPIGQRIQLESGKEQPRLIVGIVGDVLHAGLDTEPKPWMYLPHQQFAFPFMSIAVQTSSEPGRVAPALREAVRSVDKNVPLSGIKTMEEQLAESLLRQRLTMLVLGLFAGLAVVLAAIGLYGLMAYNVNERTQEIGIRMALGARSGDVWRLVLGQALILTATGVAAGLMASFWLTRGLSSLLYSVSPTDLATFVLIPLLLIGVGLAASWIPARRASKVSPLLALRYE